MGDLIIRQPKHNWAATTAPLKTTDITQGYGGGSHVIDVVHVQLYICMKPTENEADWRLTGGTFVKNISGAEILKGKIVYQDTSTGGVPTIKLAKADVEPTSAGTWAMVVETISDGAFGYVKEFGPVHTLNTSAFNDGALLWLSATSGGDYQATEPNSPFHGVFIGRVNKSHNNEGVIACRVQNGIELKEAHDVSSTVNPTADMQVLAWLTDTGLYTPDDVIPDMKRSGLIAWGGSGDYYSITANKFKILRPGSGRICGKLVSWDADIETDTLGANTANFIYIDPTGGIAKTTTRTGDLFVNNVPLFIVLYDGTNHVVVKEDHPYSHGTAESNDKHDTIGTVFEPGGGVYEQVTIGTGAAATDRQLKQTGDVEIHDHGIEAHLLDSSGAAVSVEHYYTNASGKWVRDSSSASFPLKYNAAGTPTAISLSPDKFGVFRIYLSKDDLTDTSAKLFSVMHSAEYNTQSLANTAIAANLIPVATNELATLEMAAYGYIIVKNTSAGGHIIETIIQKRVVGGQLETGGSSNSASLTTTNVTPFDKFLSPADSNVQAALETVNDLGASVSETNTGTAINKAVTPDSLAGSIYGTRVRGLKVIKDDTDLTTDVTGTLTITDLEHGMELVKIEAKIYTPSSSGDVVTIFKKNGTDVLTTSSPTIAEGNKRIVSTSIVSNDDEDVVAGDEIVITVPTSVGVGAKGLEFYCHFRTK